MSSGGNRRGSRFGGGLRANPYQAEQLGVAESMGKGKAMNSSSLLVSTNDVASTKNTLNNTYNPEAKRDSAESAAFMSSGPLISKSCA